MKKYELLATLKPNLDNDEADKIVAKVEEIVTGFGGKVDEIEKMGRKKLSIPADKIVDFRRQLKLNENIIRTMFVELKK